MDSDGRKPKFNQTHYPAVRAIGAARLIGALGAMAER
jgi:hypothetical protein